MFLLLIFELVLGPKCSTALTGPAIPPKDTRVLVKHLVLAIQARPWDPCVFGAALAVGSDVFSGSFGDHVPGFSRQVPQTIAADLLSFGSPAFLSAWALNIP